MEILGMISTSILCEFYDVIIVEGYHKDTVEREANAQNIRWIFL